MRTESRSCDVVVVGSGLAGLTAADRLARKGIDVRALEARSVTGGRVLRGDEGGDIGAEFVGKPHTALRELITDLGLQTTSARLDHGPILWRIAGSTRSSVLPPGRARELWSLGTALWRLRARALRLDTDAPWTSPGISELDSTTLAAWLSHHGVSPHGLALADALIGGFATRPIDDMSAAHAAWWMAAAGGLIAAARSGQQYIVPGGAYQIPQRLTSRLGDRVQREAPVRSISTADGGVEIAANADIWRAKATIVAVPLPSLPRIVFEPPLAATLHSLSRQLSYGNAVKIAATATVAPPERHRSVVGGHPLAIAWRRGRALAGIATGSVTADELINDLASAFGVPADSLTGVGITDWTHRDYIGGSYLVYRPGQIQRLAPVLRRATTDLVRFAGSDFSFWPNSMEGAVRSGRDAADALLRVIT
ncbi:MAG: FAD-dependent oxidoreductase [Actinomycetia bacterium]|nr:FAD-dependent oxidoreductase [Actinomycetes bacterium]